MAILILILQIAACVGFGTVVLRGFGVIGDLSPGERLTWSFAIGYGVVGWLLFFMGVAVLFQPAALTGLLIAGVLGLVALWGIPAVAAKPKDSSRWGLFDGVLIAALAAALVFDLAEGLAPPADADTLAYHFALPKLFIEVGRLVFIERAMDGAVPLLNQMTYIPVLALGGEKALTLWAMTSGWGATALLYTVSRRFLDRRWSLAIAIIFLTTPAVVYGGGSGQVEVRNAMFVMVAAFSVARAVTTGHLRHAGLAGLAVGFFMAGKYIGLLFALACGIAILFQRQWFRHGLVLTAIAFVAGGQWYLWNYIHAGDPFFPMLYGVLDYSAVSFWNAEHHAGLQKLFEEFERGVSTNVLWLMIYPFVATFSGLRQFESIRTGLGPFIMLALPFALAGAWQFRDRLRNHPLLIVVVIAVLFYSLWFLIGSSQRVRHLTPVLPLALLALTFAAHRWAQNRSQIKPLMAAVVVTLGFQLAGHGVFGLNYVRHVVSGETRQAFLQRNVHSYRVATWVNANLTQTDRLYSIYRHLNYLLDVPYYYAHVQQEGVIDIRPEADNSRRFLEQIDNLGISHLLVGGDPALVTPTNGLLQWRPLLAANCLDMVSEIETLSIGSRALGTAVPGKAYILKRNAAACSL